MTKRTYLVSGAGSGIGRAIAQAIAAASTDNRVALLGRKVEALEETRRALPLSDQHFIVKADLRDREGLSTALSALKPQSLNLCGVIANAGVGGENHYGEGDRWSEIIESNLTGTYLLVNECLPALRASKETYKHIVITSSILARLGVPGYSAYCASKAGLLGLMRSWAAELAKERILVNAVCPGWVETDMARQGIEIFAKNTGRTYDECYKEAMQPVALGKMSQPEEIGTLVSYLVSGAQVSITGQAIDINNGALMV